MELDGVGGFELTDLGLEVLDEGLLLGEGLGELGLELLGFLS